MRTRKRKTTRKDLDLWVGTDPAEGFRRLFYFTGSARIIENLLNERIKISEFGKCNDVFELASVNLYHSGVRRKQKAWVRSVEEKMGLICFTKCWKHPLMWAHYSENGRGVCLVVDVESSSLFDVEFLEHKDKSPAVKDTKFPEIDDDGFRAFCSKKAAYWEYEREVRMFANYNESDVVCDDGLRFIKLGRRIKLVGIINGPRPTLGQSILKKAAPGIEYFQCRPANTKFEMIANGAPRSWKL